MNDTPSLQDPNDRSDEEQHFAPWPAEMCRQLIESAPWPMFVVDCETRRVTEANPAALAKYQLTLEELRSQGVGDKVLPPERRIEVGKLLDAKLDGPPVDTYSEHILPDRTLLPVEVRSFRFSGMIAPPDFS